MIIFTFITIQLFNNALAHGSWRKGEIAKQKCIAYAVLNDIENAIGEMRILRNIGRGWYKESDYTSNPLFKNIVKSESYLNFTKETK